MFLAPQLCQLMDTIPEVSYLRLLNFSPSPANFLVYALSREIITVSFPYACREIDARAADINHRSDDSAELNDQSRKRERTQ